MAEILGEFKFALRQLWNRPLWAATVVSVLTLGIAANIAMFSAFEAWVIRPLAFDDPDALVAIYESEPQRGRSGIRLSPKNYADFIEAQSSFDAIGAFRRHRFNLNDASQSIRLDGARITASLFPLLGKEPLVGRVFNEREDRPGQPEAVAIISERLWRERMVSDPRVLGRTIRLDGLPHEIVGVMEPGFMFPEWAEIWTPLGADTVSVDRANRFLSVVGRLADGVTLLEAREQAIQVGGQLATEYPETNRDHSFEVVPLRRDMVPKVIETALLVSLASGVLVLLIICANVASLILAQAAARSRETAVRTAMGASRGRLMRQNFIESVSLTLPAGIAGAGLGLAILNYLISWIPVDPPYLFQTRFSGTTGWYTFGLSLFAAAVCAMAPTIRNSSQVVSETLKAGGDRSGSGKASSRLRHGLILMEVALSTAMLVGALLMVKSFHRLQQTDRGYQTQNVWTAELSLSSDDVRTDADRRRIVQRLMTSVEQVERVSLVGVSSNLPTGQTNRVRAYFAEGEDRTPGEPGRVRASVQSIAGNYLETLDIPLLAGRPFSALEVLEGGDVAIISEGMAQQLWRDDNVLGRRFGWRSEDGDEWHRVVGIVPNLDYGRDFVTMRDIPPVQAYFPYAEITSSSVAVVFRSDVPPEVFAGNLQSAFRQAAPGLPLTGAISMDDAILQAQWVSGFFSRQLSFYAVFALIIASLGLYGLTADSVSRRQREMAIRSALGADSRTLIKMIVRETAHISIVGLVLGLILASIGASAASKMLMNVSPQDPAVFTFVGLSFLAISTLAALIPARKASAIHPATSLRSD